MATVDIKTAALILDRALIEAAPVEDEIAAIIATVLRGTHKTYRYILVNALLAKATRLEHCHGNRLPTLIRKRHGFGNLLKTRH